MQESKQSARPSARQLRHIPGEDGWPVLGQTLAFLADQEGWTRRMYERHGAVFRNNVFFERSVALIRPDAVHTVLRDKASNFSSKLGWDSLIGRFFGGGLMLRDFEDHRVHRGLLQEAFKRSALVSYLETMAPLITEHVQNWGARGRLRFYPAIKQLTLDLASAVLLGLPFGARLKPVQRAFVDMLLAPFALLPFAIPGLAYWRGLRGRTYLEQLFHALIRERRNGQGRDMLTQLCRAVSADGERMTDQDVVNHLMFVMMAGHDTTTSVLTNMVHMLGAHPDWQERLRTASLAIGRPELSYDELSALTDIDLVLKETLRLYPPVVAIPRRTLRECEIDGIRIPANTTVWLEARLTHTLPEYWTRPLEFDPERFSESRAEHKQHPGLFYPYGAGAHTCLGMQFSSVQAKAILHQLLTSYRVRLVDGYAPKRQIIPFPKPTDDLPVILEPIVCA